MLFVFFFITILFRMKSETIIVAAMKEHEHKMLNLESDSKNVLSQIESSTKNSEMEKNNRLLIR